ncbi:MAG: glycosyl transferase [Gaiellaceae bacterium]
MDELTRELLERLDLPGVEAVPLRELEAHDRELVAVKPSSTSAEYYWTAKPAICLYLLEREPTLTSITHLDVDLMFFADPAPIFEELADDPVLITPHRYAPGWEWEAERHGIYNAQFATFRRTEAGMSALRWWRGRCLDWCYDRIEDGKMGDQKYLDDWPTRFTDVHVLEHPGGGLAPWNIERHTVERSGGSIMVDKQPLIFFHYQSLRVYRSPFGRTPLPAPYRRIPSHALAWSTPYPVSASHRHLIWRPYLRQLAAAIADARTLDPSPAYGVTHLPREAVARALARRMLPHRMRSALRGIAHAA